MITEPVPDPPQDTPQPRRSRQSARALTPNEPPGARPSWHGLVITVDTVDRDTIYEELRRHMSAEYDAGGSIGKRYRRQDEIGTPWGVTVDHQTMDDGTVTRRDRDALEQARLPAAELADELRRRLGD